MKRFVLLALVSLFAFACVSFAAPNPNGMSDDMYYANMDVFGTIDHTIPYTSPGTSNAWVGISYAQGTILQFKNVASPTSSQMLRINPITGAVISTVTLAYPTPGYMMEGAWDGTNLYCCQWYPSGGIHKMTLAGTYVATLTPTITGSPRGIAWDGSNLWVGTNVGSNVTNLYKMTPSGTVLSSWVTNTNVGWYMGMDWACSAPADGHLVIVDNVGNTLKRLSTPPPPGLVSILNSVPSPAASPDVAEGLGFDGSLMIHCGAYASLLVGWFIDEGFGQCPLNLSLDTSPVAPPIVIPSGGGNFNYNLHLTNNALPDAQVQLWNKVFTGTTYYTVFGPTFPKRLIGQFTANKVLTQFIAGTIPGGPLLFISYVGEYPNIAASDSFMIYKDTVAVAGPWISESYVTGDLNFDEVSVAAPAQFALMGNYPNPFNPTTSINYTLATAGNVKLTVFDATGREVATLVNGYRDAGSHQVTFDASRLASGVYLYQLNSAGQVAVGKMVLMK